MSSGRVPVFEVQHLKLTSFLLQSHFHKCALDLHFIDVGFIKEVYLKHPKRKGYVSIEKGIRSKVKCTCRSSAHFPPIWEGTGCQCVSQAYVDASFYVLTDFDLNVYGPTNYLN